jgi:hypothetical protein
MRFGFEASGRDFSGVCAIGRALVSQSRSRQLNPCILVLRETSEIPLSSSTPQLAVHSITSSARASRVGGTSRLSSLAVFRLMTNSYLVGC